MLSFLFEFLIIIFLCPGVLACLYYWFLAVYSLTSSISTPGDDLDAPSNNFAIIIPAHNEEAVIAITIKSCLEQDYPFDKFKIFVIADNCTDATAKIAEDNKVACLVRKDERDIGKGHALSWAFSHILPQGFDGIVVLDADCIIDKHALREFDKYFHAGNLVLQANDVASNPDDSPMSYAMAVGNVIENDLFYAPKSDLGLSVFLRGTGMVFHRDLLTQFPWKAHSIVEDVEYTLILLRHGYQIKFVKNVKVRSSFPVTREQLNVQRTRWACGNLSFGKKNALNLFFEGLVNKNLRVMDAGFTFFVLSRPLVIAEIILACTVSGIYWLIDGGLLGGVYFGIAISALLSFIGYFGLGILLLGINIHRLYFLLAAPFVLTRLIFIAIINVFGIKNLSWHKTPR